MEAEERPYEPSWAWRIKSGLTIGTVGFLCRSFLYGFSKTEVHGLDGFLELIDKRADAQGRDRGLITVSNHVSVLDDPGMWGVLPYRYHWNPNNSRWGLGSYDICFKNGQRSLLSTFFSYGNTLPTHRAAHSRYGGLFQPTMTQAIRLLSDPHCQRVTRSHPTLDDPLAFSLPPSDPFSSSHLTYTTTGLDSFPAPSAYPSRRYSWIHIFPEGKIHQHPDKIMRYFKWGVARLLLESEPCPDVVAIWIDGLQDVMSERRTWPRPLPRPGKSVSITFGEPVDTETVFGPLRQRWREMKEKSRRERSALSSSSTDSIERDGLGTLHDDDLKYGPEAEQLRIDVTMAVRNEVLKVRRATGLSDEDPKCGLMETWREEGSQGRLEGEMEDRSRVRDV